MNADQSRIVSTHACVYASTKRIHKCSHVRHWTNICAHLYVPWLDCMCDVTHLCVSTICIHTCDTTHPCMCPDPLICAMTRLHVRRDSFMIWLRACHHVCTWSWPSYVWRVSFKWVTWLIHVRPSIRMNMVTVGICVMSLVHVCEMTHSCQKHLSATEEVGNATCVNSYISTCFTSYIMLAPCYKYEYRLYMEHVSIRIKSPSICKRQSICDMAHSRVIRRLTHTCDII